MKKISLLSLLTVLAISTGAKANVENPLYTPAEGKIYSKTEAGYSDKDWRFIQKVGYGITDKFNIAGSVDYWVTAADDEYNYEGENTFSTFKLDAGYRVIDGNVKTDLYANYETDIDEDFAGDFDAYGAGLKVGTVNDKYTVAGKLGYQYIDVKDEEIDSHNFVIGAEGLYQFDDRVSGQLGVEYTLVDEVGFIAGEEDTVQLRAQVNYNKGGLWSIFYTTELKADDVEDTVGLKYGIQF